MPPPVQELIGSLAAILTTASFLPQVVKTLRTRDTRAISLWMYLLFCAGVGLWGVYGILLGSWPIILANGLTFTLAAVILSLKVRELIASAPESTCSTGKGRGAATVRPPPWRAGPPGPAASRRIPGRRRWR